MRLENLGVVETETDRDWTKVVETETLTRVLLFSALWACKDCCFQLLDVPASNSWMFHPIVRIWRILTYVVKLFCIVRKALVWYCEGLV